MNGAAFDVPGKRRNGAVLSITGEPVAAEPIQQRYLEIMHDKMLSIHGQYAELFYHLNEIKERIQCGAPVEPGRFQFDGETLRVEDTLRASSPRAKRIVKKPWSGGPQ